ncbi:hypothetical protein QLX08_011262 [Tetragonisca angustula]|uniref:Uncharacterized protein n=1 Tax=Tetragonisca angustula TaxID=166442 RepID=A0AAW0Z8P8_9HYME
MFEEDTKYIDTEPGEEAYDYNQFKKEYEEQIEKYIYSNKTINFTDEEKLKEQPKEVLQKLIDFKNCTNITGVFNIKPLNCLIHNYEQQKDKPVVKRLLQKIYLTIKVWFLIYVCVAIPCWCHKGWCCWCFRFKFCFPKKRILFAKQYYANNPPGVFRQIQIKKEKEREPITYEPTIFEEDRYEKLKAEIKNI